MLSYLLVLRPEPCWAAWSRAYVALVAFKDARGRLVAGSASA